VAATEFGDTADPVPVPPAGGAEPVQGVVQDPAIAHQGAAPWPGNDLAGGEDAVLERHRASPFAKTGACPNLDIVSSYCYHCGLDLVAIHG
jgi:hypothetical protein